MKAVIFDLDGTILDTLQDLTDSVNYALSRHSLPPRTSAEVRHFLGNGMQRLITLSVPEGTDAETFDGVFRDFTDYYKVHCTDKTGPYPHIREVIASLRARGLRTALVSNKGDYAVQLLIRDMFDGLFDYACGEKQGIRRKPAPDTVNECLRQLGLTASEAIYVGDSEVDIQTARNAGMGMVTVTWGFRDRPDLIEAGAGVMIDRPEDLPDALLLAMPGGENQDPASLPAGSTESK